MKCMRSTASAECCLEFARALLLNMTWQLNSTVFSACAPFRLCINESHNFLLAFAEWAGDYNGLVH